MRFARALAVRIPAAAVGNLALIVGLVVLTWSSVRLHVVVWLVLAWMVLLSLWRLRVASRAKTLEEAHTRRWLRDFGITTATTGVTWGSLGAAWLALHGMEPTTVLVMVTIAGVASAASHVSAPSLPALRAFTVGALGPSVVVLLVHQPSPVSIELALVLAAFAAFLWVQGRHLHADFLDAQVRAYRLEKQSLRLRDSREALRVQATRDGLTGTFNRAAGLDVLGQELQRARRERRPLSVVMIDLDHFKRINDTHGHAGGDAVLRGATLRMRAALRPYDLFARFGGEEFFLVLPGCDLGSGVAVAERLREALAAAPVQHDAVSIAVTASLGVALALDDDAPEALLARADQAMYEAKTAGRNRVRAAQGASSEH